MAMVCMCGGHEGVCLPCFEKSRGRWSLLDHKPKNWREHHLMFTELTPEIKKLGEEYMDRVIGNVLSFAAASREHGTVPNAHEVPHAIPETLTYFAWGACALILFMIGKDVWSKVFYSYVIFRSMTGKFLVCTTPKVLPSPCNTSRMMAPLLRV